MQMHNPPHPARGHCELCALSPWVLSVTEGGHELLVAESDKTLSSLLNGRLRH